MYHHGVFVGDRHNQYRQKVLSLELTLVTNIWYVRLFHTLLGMVIMNAFLANKHFYFHKDPRPLIYLKRTIALAEQRSERESAPVTGATCGCKLKPDLAVQPLKNPPPPWMEHNNVFPKCADKAIAQLNRAECKKKATRFVVSVLTSQERCPAIRTERLGHEDAFARVSTLNITTWSHDGFFCITVLPTCFPFIALVFVSFSPPGAIKSNGKSRQALSPPSLKSIKI